MNKKQKTIAKNLNEFFGYVFALIAIFSILVRFEVDFAVTLINDKIPAMQDNSLFIIIPVLLGTWCFNNSEKFKKK